MFLRCYRRAEASVIKSDKKNGTCLGTRKVQSKLQPRRKPAKEQRKCWRGGNNQIKEQNKKAREPFLMTELEKDVKLRPQSH